MLATLTGNRILDRLPEDERGHLLSPAEVVFLPRGQEVYRQDGPMPHVYFPLKGVISTVILVEEGEQVEAATVGHEGMTGLAAYLGVSFSPFRTVSQVPGESLRVPTAAFLAATRPGGTLDRLVRRYAAYSLRYANQTVACNALHAAPERMCRWLLMTHDRAGQDEFELTHEFLAEMLGVRRQTVTVIAGTLQGAGLLTYRRGVIRVLDREGLEAASCECYQAIKDLYERIVQ